MMSNSALTQIEDQSNDVDKELALLATDPQIQNELREIEQEFPTWNPMGWKQPDANSTRCTLYSPLQSSALSLTFFSRIGNMLAEMS